MSPRATSTHLLNISTDGDSTTSLGSLFQCLIPLSEKKYILISDLNLPCCNLRPTSRPITCYLAEETDPHFATTSFQILVENNEFSTEPPFLLSSLSCFSEDLCSRLFLGSIALHWTFSSTSISFFYCGTQN